MGSTTTPKTDLEIFQALQIEALQKELLKVKELMIEMSEDMQKCINGMEVTL